MSPDVRRILAAQGARAFGYGLGAVLLGSSLRRSGYSSTEAGAVLAAVLAGTILTSVAVARWADRLGRRRCYRALYLSLAAAALVFALARSAWPLVLVSLGGGLSPEVVESGPFTSLEQAMLAGQIPRDRIAHGFGVYNAVASIAGSLGALAAAIIGALQHRWAGAPSAQHCFLVLLPAALAGVALASRLTTAVEAPARTPDAARHGGATPRGASHGVVVRLSALFALDAFGGGFVVQAFVAFWLAQRFDASLTVLGVTFFAVGVVQTASFLVAGALGSRFGLLATMVCTHLPSNLLLVAMAFAPDLATAIALLLARVALSQMDVPTRQAYVMALVEPGERTVAAATTNTARYVARPIGPLLAGSLQSVALGAPFVVAGAIKSVYDVVLWRWFRDVELPAEAVA